MMKKAYQHPEMDTVLFESNVSIMAAGTSSVDPDPFDDADDNNFF